MHGKKTLAALTAIIMCLILVCGASAFSGESAAVNRLLDLMLKQDASRLGEELVNGLMELARTEFVNMISSNPDVMDPAFFSMSKYFVAVLGPLFVSVILISGIYLMFFSGSPETRTRIKGMLPLIVAAMVLVLISPHIMNIILYFSESLTTGILTMMNSTILPKNVTNPMLLLLPYDSETNPITYLMDKFQRITWYSSEASMPFLLISAFLLLSLLMVAVARYLIVSAFIIIFPLTIFLYLISYTRSLGRRLMEQTLLWIFLQAVEAIVLLAVVSLISLSAATLVPEVLVLFQVVGLVMLIAVPIATVALFKDFLPT